MIRIKILFFGFIEYLNFDRVIFFGKFCDLTKFSNCSCQNSGLFFPFFFREDAENALRYINGTRLDDRIIRTDWDAGFIEGRQFGRGKSGGQVRDEYRTDFDAGRGGYGQIVQQKLEIPNSFT